MLRYNPNLKDKSQQLRKNMTDGERALWSRLRNKQILGVQFYRQKPIGGYIVDFYAPQVKIVLEVDGSQHSQNHHAQRDRNRDEYLSSLGLQVLRFNSREVLEESEAVVEMIFRSTAERQIKNPPVPPFSKGGKEFS